MTSSQIRQSFLDFFKSKEHTIVPSSSLMPDSPNLLFTNAGMNQFVPIFLGQTKCPYTPGRAADTQKCIRAGGKHNDLDDVGLDTYHHTFFEMLGNWSFGDYAKKEAIAWAWELVIEVWKFPPQRVYATIYNPDRSKGDPAERDEEAWNLWAEKFRSVNLDPAIHIVNGNKKDNFWMMGETGPCGPCTEIHIDLRPGPRETDLETQISGAKLVNGSDARCIEIWNNVFIQYNANPDGTFTPLPAQHVDTGMGFERVTSIIQGTKGLQDFQNAKISNYETDIFRPLFDRLEKLSGRKYGSTLPLPGATSVTEQEKIDIAFRVISDHIRTLSFAIADGIQPGNNDRNYVLRRILRRAVRYGRSLGFKEPFFFKLVDVLSDTMGDVFPEIRAKKSHVQEVIRVEEESFNKTLDKGLQLFDGALESIQFLLKALPATKVQLAKIKASVGQISQADSSIQELFQTFENPITSEAFRDGEELKSLILSLVLNCRGSNADKSSQSAESDKLQKELLEILGRIEAVISKIESIPAGKLPKETAFVLYDTYGFPLDLTELMAREKGLTVDTAGFEKLMEEQRARARAAQKKEVISLSQIETTTPTKFIGFDQLQTQASVLEVVSLKDKTAVILDVSAAYAEMGGQVGDTGELTGSGQLWRFVNTQKSGNTWLHFLDSDSLKLETPPAAGSSVSLSVHAGRRHAIERHHSVTHLLHWALHEVVSKEASQKGSSVGPDKLTFDFNSGALTAQQIEDIEALVNERIVENAVISWSEVPYTEVKSNSGIMQFFGDKYGDIVRVVQIGGAAGKLNGYSMELCGGTHSRATGEIGLFRIVSESAVAAGVRRIEAVAGLAAYHAAKTDAELIRLVAEKLSAPVGELEKKVDAVLALQKELEKKLKAFQQKQAADAAKGLIAHAHESAVSKIPSIVMNLGGVDGDYLQAVADALKGEFKGVVVLGGTANGAVALLATVSAEHTKAVQAGKIIQTIAPIVGGKGGGKPDNARGGGKDVANLDEALNKARTLF